MNTTIAKEWILRVVGYGAAAVSAWLGGKISPEFGHWIGGGVAIGGAAIVNKAIPYILPTAAKVAAAQAMPKPVPAYKPKALQ
jgi:hypothetical protein